MRNFFPQTLRHSRPSRRVYPADMRYVRHLTSIASTNNLEVALLGTDRARRARAPALRELTVAILALEEISKGGVGFSSAAAHTAGWQASNYRQKLVYSNPSDPVAITSLKGELGLRAPSRASLVQQAQRLDLR
jgi:hypothetical protein